MFRPHGICPAQGCLCFPRLHCSGSRLLHMERALRCVRFQFSGPPQKRRFGCACVLCLPRLSGLGSQGLGRPLPGRGAPFPSTASGPGSQRLGALPPGAVRLFPPRRAAWAARGLEPCPRARPAFSLHSPSARRRRWGLRKSLDRNPRLFAGWEGVASLGLSLPLAPPPYLLPPSGMGRLFSEVSQPLCFANRRRCVPAG